MHSRTISWNLPRLQISKLLIEASLSGPSPCSGADSCCTSDNPCSEGEGDCDWDSECWGDLVCGDDNCDGEGFDDTDDCCKTA